MSRTRGAKGTNNGGRGGTTIQNIQKARAAAYRHVKLSGTMLVAWVPNMGAHDDDDGHIPGFGLLGRSLASPPPPFPFPPTLSPFSPCVPFSLPLLFLSICARALASTGYFAVAVILCRSADDAVFSYRWHSRLKPSAPSSTRRNHLPALGLPRATV